MGTKRKDVKDTAQVEKQDVSVVLFDGFTWFLRFVISMSVTVVVIWLVSMALIPATGQMLLDITGVGPETTIAGVMAAWLVPQLFIAGLCGYATIVFVKWFWKKTGEISVKANAVFRENHERKLREKLVGKPKDAKKKATRAQERSKKAVSDASGDSDSVSDDSASESSGKRSKFPHRRKRGEVAVKSNSETAAEDKEH